MKMVKVILAAVVVISAMNAAMAASSINYHGFYAGLMGGYAETTWSNLVGQDVASATSTPKSVKEGGLSLGGFVGYQVLPGLGFELAYYHIPTAKIAFDLDHGSTYWWDDGVAAMSTHTNVVAFDVKMSTPIAHNWRLFGKIGVEATHRSDTITARPQGVSAHSNTLAHFHWRVGSIFGAGFQYAINSHWSADLGFDYISGFGDAEVNPVYHYAPFVYQAYGDVAYHFAV